MNDAQLHRLDYFLKNKKTRAAIRRAFGGQFDMTIKDGGDFVTIQFRQKDSGNALMTFSDVACVLNTDTRAVRRLNEKRARSKARFPFPTPIKLAGEITRFRRSEVLAWIEQHKQADIKLPFHAE